jgi:hypothetical protein
MRSKRRSERSADLRCVRSATFTARQRLPARFTIASARHRVQIDRMSGLRRPFLHLSPFLRQMIKTHDSVNLVKSTSKGV